MSKAAEGAYLSSLFGAETESNFKLFIATGEWFVFGRKGEGPIYMTYFARPTASPQMALWFLRPDRLGRSEKQDASVEASSDRSWGGRCNCLTDVGKERSSLSSKTSGGPERHC